MILFDEKARRWYDDDTGDWVPDPPAVDHSQNPVIGIVLLLVVFYVVYVTSGAPVIVWVP
jgi:hypothetical protein